MARRSLRSRVALGIALLSLLITSVHSVAFFLITETQEEDQINELVSEQLESLIGRRTADPNGPLLQTEHIKTYVARDQIEVARLPEYLRDLPAGVHEVFEGSREWHVAVRPVGATRFVVAYDAAAHEARLGEFAWWLLAGVGVTVVAAAALAYAVAGFLTRPVSDLARAVSRLGAGPAPPLTGRYRDAEVRQLAEAFDQYSARMVEFVTREREFTSNVSHELRTPLTAIRTSCELLLADAELSVDARRRLERVLRAAEQMNGLIQSLLLLARAGRTRPTEIVALQECVADTAEPLRDLAAAQAVEFRNEVAGDAMAHVDRAALNVVLANLLRNAIASTRGGRVIVRLRAGALEIEDSGAGIAADDLPHVFNRFYRGRGSQERDGHGLGLAIVKQICDQHGWSLSLESEEGAGTRARLYFPPSAEFTKN